MTVGAERTNLPLSIPHTTFINKRRADDINVYSENTNWKLRSGTFRSDHSPPCIDTHTLTGQIVKISKLPDRVPTPYPQMR